MRFSFEIQYPGFNKLDPNETRFAWVTVEAITLGDALGYLGHILPVPMAVEPITFAHTLEDSKYDFHLPAQSKDLLVAVIRNLPPDSLQTIH